MDDPGQRLKRARERLDLRYRDVEEASLRIAARHHNDEFAIALSRLADIENKGTVPSIYRLYSLCAIYRLDYAEALRWYGLDLGWLISDALETGIDRTHTVNFTPAAGVEVGLPLALDPGIDPRRTTFLSRAIQRWGKVPLALLNGAGEGQRYGFVGLEDWTMYPLIPPGSFVVIDPGKRKIASGGWTTEYERPVYFLEHREGFSCAWCSVNDGRLVAEPHPASWCSPAAYDFPEEIEVVGQVTAVAMTLDPGRRRRARF